MGTAVPIFKTLNKLYLDNYQFSMVSFSKKVLKNQQKKLFSVKKTKEVIIIRNPNGFGSIKKLGGKRRRPFGVYITTGWDMVNGKAKQIQKCIGYYATRPEAMIALAEYNKNPYDIDKRSITFQQVYDILLDSKFNKMKPAAKSAYTGAYKKCASIYNIRMTELRKAHMQAIVDEYSDKSKALQSNFLKLFHAIYDFSLENDICEKDYSKFVEVTSEQVAKDKTPFSREEVQLLWENLDWVKNIEVYRGKTNSMSILPLMDSVLIMLYTGVRISELLDMKVDDIHLEERWIDLRGTKTKAAKRIVPIHQKIVPLLEKRLAGKGANDYIISKANGNKIVASQYRDDFFYPMCENFNLTHTPHECRHSFATYAAASKLNPILLKKIIGHSAQDLTQDTYTHAFIEDLVAEIDKYNL